MRGEWLKIIKPTKGKNPIPAGLMGVVFWEDIDYFGNEKVGLDISGVYGQGIFVAANKCEPIHMDFLDLGKTVREVDEAEEALIRAGLPHDLSCVRKALGARIVDLSEVGPEPQDEPDWEGMAEEKAMREAEASFEADHDLCPF